MGLNQTKNSSKLALVSVVIPAYNVEKYIDECIRSALKQSYGNIEIICVSDGSTDGTEQIVRVLKEKHANLKLICQENAGRGGARNTGIKAVTGKYIFFLDADDRLPENAIAILENTIRKERTEYVTGNMESFRGRRSWSTHGRNFRRYMGCTNLAYSPFLIQDPCVCNKLFDAAFIQKKQLVFEPRMGKEDFVFATQAACAATRISIITDTIYHYRAREDENNISGSQRLGDQFIKDLFRTSELADQAISKLAKADDLKPRKDGEVVRMLINRIPHKLIGYQNIDEARPFLEIIQEGIPTLDEKSLRKFPLKQYLFCHLAVNGKFQQAWDIFDSSQDKSIFKLSGLDIFNDLETLEELSPDTLSVTVRKLSSVITKPRPTPGNILGAYGQSIQLSLRFIYKRLKRIFRYFWPNKRWILERLAGLQSANRYINSKSQKQTWIIGERFGNYAGDNGFALFNYLLKNNNDEISPYFVLKSTSPQYAQFKRSRGIIRYGSLSHLKVLLKSQVFLFTDKINDVCPRRFAAELATNPFFPRTFVMLHHGYMYLKSTSYKTYHRNNFGIPVDAFVANSEHEKKFLVKHAGYDPDQIIVTGFCRFDNLLQYRETHDYILFFPTWRRGMKEWSETEFRNSYFFKQIMSLINNQTLLDNLNRYGLKVKFYLHFNMLQWLDCFSTISDLVEIQKPDNADVTSLINNCAMLVTDFSTICFDVAYMDKPVIFYDLGMETEDKLEQGPISENYESELFGSMIGSETALIAAISDYINNDFRCQEEYRERRKLFFKNIDSNNSKRLVAKINEITTSKRSPNQASCLDSLNEIKN